MKTLLKKLVLTSLTLIAVQNTTHAMHVQTYAPQNMCTYQQPIMPFINPVCPALSTGFGIGTPVLCKNTNTNKLVFNKTQEELVDTKLKNIAETNGYGYKVVSSQDVQKYFSGNNFNPVHEWTKITENTLNTQDIKNAFDNKKLPEQFVKEIEKLSTNIKNFFEQQALSIENCSMISSCLNYLSRYIFEETPLIKAIRPFIDAAQKENKKLIVRSTGMEDKKGLANAGGNESIKFIEPNIPAVLRAISEVIASYISPKSLTQRLISGDKTVFDLPAMPVLIQVMGSQEQNQDKNIPEPLTPARQEEHIAEPTKDTSPENSSKQDQPIPALNTEQEKHAKRQKAWAQFPELKEEAEQEETLYQKNTKEVELETFIDGFRDKWFCLDTYKNELTQNEQIAVKDEYKKALETGNFSELADKLKAILSKKTQEKTDLSKKPKSQKFKIVSISFGKDRKPFASLSEKSIKTYAEKQGYTCKIYNDYESPKDKDDLIYWADGKKAKDLPEEWLKISAVRQELEDPTVEWVLWVDDDMYITNPETTIESYVEQFGKNKFFIVANDPSCNNPANYDFENNPENKIGFNNGIFLIKNCPEAKVFLKAIWEKGIAGNGYKKRGNVLLEQQAMNDWLAENPDFMTGVHIFETSRGLQGIIRSNPNDPNNSKWQAGDFVAHLTGVPKKYRSDVMSFLDGILSLPQKIRTLFYPDNYVNRWVMRYREYKALERTRAFKAPETQRDERAFINQHISSTDKAIIIHVGIFIGNLLDRDDPEAPKLMLAFLNQHISSTDKTIIIRVGLSIGKLLKNLNNFRSFVTGLHKLKAPALKLTLAFINQYILSTDGSINYCVQNFIIKHHKLKSPEAPKLILEFINQHISSTDPDINTNVSNFIGSLLDRDDPEAPKFGLEYIKQHRASTDLQTRYNVKKLREYLDLPVKDAIFMAINS